MAKKELVDYFKQCQVKKISLEKASRELVKKGWSEKDVNEALKVIKPPSKVTKAPLKPPAPPKAPAPTKALMIAKPTITELTLGQKIKGFITNPINTFSAVKEEGLGAAFRYYALLALIPSLMIGLLFTLIGLALLPFGKMLLPQLGAGFVGIFLLIVLIYIFSLVGVWINGLLIHLGVLIFARPNKGLGETYKALMYGATPALLFGWIPIIGYLVPFWALVLGIIGVKGLHETNTGRAVIAMLFIPIIAMIFMFVIIGLYFTGTLHRIFAPTLLRGPYSQAEIEITKEKCETYSIEEFCTKPVMLYNEDARSMEEKMCYEEPINARIRVENKIISSERDCEALGYEL